MSIEEAIYSRLTGSTALTDLVSTRIYPSEAPQDAANPRIVYWRVSNPMEFLLNSSDELLAPRFQFDIYSTSFSQARSIARQVRTRLNKWGDLTGTPSIARCDVVNEFDGYDWDLNLHQSVVEVEIMHTSTL